MSDNWILNYLSKYFNVTTTEVVERILWSAIPIRKPRSDAITNAELLAPLTYENISTDKNDDTDPYFSSKQQYYSYMERFIQSRPDFYGPFWISSTLVFIIAIASNIVSFAHHSVKDESVLAAQAKQSGSAEALLTSRDDTKLNSWHYSMDELNMSSGLIMTYLALVPTLFWFTFWFRGCSKYYTFTETICAFGYSLSIFIPLAVILTIQAVLVRYFMITLAAALSGSVLLLSFLPVAQSDPNPASSHIIIALIPLCQFVLAYCVHRIML